MVDAAASRSGRPLIVGIGGGRCRSVTEEREGTDDGSAETEGFGVKNMLFGRRFL